MKRRDFIRLLGGAAAWPLAVRAQHSSVASAADIKFLSAGALQPVMKELLPGFEQTSGHKVTVTYASAGANTGRVQKCEAADVAIANESQIDALIKQGKVLAGSQVKIAKVGIGVGVRKGAPKPDISSLDAFKHALMAAKAIGYLDPADGHPAAIHLVGAFERLGMTADLKPKTKLAATGAALFDALVKGDIDIAFLQSNGFADDARIELVGSPPGALANTTVFTVAIVASSKEQEAGMALIAYLSTPAAVAVFKAKHVGRD